MPRHKPSERWVTVLDTSREVATDDEAYSIEDTYPLDGRSVAVLILRTGWPETQKQLHAEHAAPLKIHTSL